MRVFLNGNEYVLEANTTVVRTPLVEFPQNIRLIGQQKREDRSLLSSWTINDWSAGLGIQRMNAGISKHTKSLWDAENVDTRYPSQIVLSPAFNTVTIVPSRGDIDLALPYLGQLYFVESQFNGTENAPGFGVAFQFTPPFTLGSYRSVADDSAVGTYVGSISAIMAYAERLVMMAHRHTENQDRFFTVASMGYNTTGNGTAGMAFGVYNAAAVKPQFALLGGTLHVIHYSPDVNTLVFCLSEMVGTFRAMRTRQTVVGTYLAPLVTDGVTMFAQLPEGVYNFDITPDIIIDTSRAQDLNCMQVMFGQDLYFKNKQSLIEYDISEATTKDVGYNVEDGLPLDKIGEITAMTSSWKYIYAAVQGPTYSHILTRDIAGAWQYYARIPTAGLWVRELFLSDAPDAIDRLWCIFGSYAFPGYFLNPMTNPLQAGTYSYVPTGQFEPPIFDGGMSEESGGFYDTTLTPDGIGGNNTITCLYGLNGAAAVTTLGVISTTPQVLTFGSPYGIEGYRIQPRFILSGANSGTTPIYREAVLHYLKLPDTREAFEFTIDLNQTAKARARPIEQVIGSLSYERDRRPLIPFWYGQIATRNVKIIDAPSSEDLEHARIYEGERSGFIRIKCAEIM